MKKALIFQGGWDGHEPALVSKRFGRILEEENFNVEIYDNLECLADLDKLLELDLIVACWTGGTNNPYTGNLSKAVVSGVGLAGCHGGMCDSFRNDTEYQFMTGGQWVSHPGGDGVEYTVELCRGSSPITEGLENFKVKSEHYYLHIDPAIEILATTRFPKVHYNHIYNKPIDMPVAWTKYWGTGRVFYLALGHHDDVFDNSPTAQILMKRGMLWAADGKRFNKEIGLTEERFHNDAKMY